MMYNNIVNLAKATVTLMACIAAIMLGGCSDSDEPDPEQSHSPTPDPTYPSNQADKLGIWSTGQPAGPEVRDYAGSIGLFGVSLPQEGFAQYAAVAPFGGECLVAILKPQPGDTDQSLRDLYVISRFDNSVNDLLLNGTPEAASRALDAAAGKCGASR